MTVTVGQCVAFDGLIQPEVIPGHQLNADKIVSAATSARTLASNLTGKADEVSAAWRALPSVFTIPDGEPMYGAMDAPSASLEVVAGRMVSMAGILEDYASTVTPIKTTLSDIKTRAQTFVNSLEPGNTVWMSARSTTTYQWDANASAHSLTGYGYGYATAGVDAQADTWHSVYDAAAYLQGRGETTRIVGGRVEILVSWLESGEHVGINNDLMDEVADAFALLSQAEAECANAINALREDACLAEVQAVEAWQLKQEGTELPWGAKVEEERNCGEQVGNGFVQFGKGTVEGLGSLISYNPITGEWGDWDFALDSWAGIGDTVVALSTVTASPIGLVNMAVNGPEAYGESLTTMTELGKSLVAWDTWEDAPAQAGTETVLNIATMFIPIGGWAAGTIKGLSKAAGLTRVTSAITRIESVTGRITSHLLPDLNRLDTPRVHLDVDTPSVKPDIDTPSVKPDTDARSSMAHDVVRASDHATPDDSPVPSDRDTTNSSVGSGEAQGTNHASSASAHEPSSSSHAEHVAALVERSGLDTEQLGTYLRRADPEGYDHWLATGELPTDVQIPKNAAVLTDTGDIDWSDVPHSGYALDAEGRPIAYDVDVTKGDVIDRYGSPRGTYTSPVNDGTPYSYEQRSLPYLEDPDQYHQYEVLRPFDEIRLTYESAPPSVRADVDRYLIARGLEWDDLTTRGGPVAPGFGDPGGGVQWQLPLPVNLLTELGMIKEVFP